MIIPMQNQVSCNVCFKLQRKTRSHKATNIGKKYTPTLPMDFMGKVETYPDIRAQHPCYHPVTRWRRSL